MNEINFIIESNRIEGIHRAPTTLEILEYERFMYLKKVTIKDLEQFVKVYQPNAVLRDQKGMDVIVGNYMPPVGSPKIRKKLDKLLKGLSHYTPFQNHIKYESLHPFTDGNGRSGRMLWMWQVRNPSLGFLHRFYYQTLSEVPRGG